MSRRAFAAAALCGLWFVSGLALAQESFTDKDATIDELVMGNPPMVKVTTSKNEVVYLKPNKSTKVKVVGKATFDFLSMGHLVQVSAMVNKVTLQVDGQAKKLKIVTQSQEYTPGMFQDVGAAADPAGAPTTGDVGPYVLVGKVMKATAGGGNKLEMMVPVPGKGNKRVRIDVVDDPDIDVEVEDLTLVKIGSKMDIVRATVAPPPDPSKQPPGRPGVPPGFGPRPGMNMPGMGMSTVPPDAKIINLAEAKVKLSEPLAGVAKKGPQRKKPAR